ncbi:MAG: hypothetical protein V6Z89_05655 [Desulfobacter sp.]
MYTLAKRNVYASTIAEFLNAQLIGDDVIITHPTTYSDMVEHSISMFEAGIQQFPDVKNILILVEKAMDIDRPGISQIVSDNPRLDYFRIVNEFYIENIGQGIHESAVVEEGACIGRNIFVDKGSFISKDSVLSNNIKIMKNVILNGKISIGNNSIVKYGSVIGSEGYSFVLDEDNIPIHFPQIGGVRIGKNVWIGSNTTIEKGFLGETVLGDNVKIDDLVHIGGNCQIGSSTMITSGVVIAVNSTIGDNCWLAPNSSISNDIVIGKNVTIGMGAVVLKDCESNGVYVGNPAKLIKMKESPKK